MNRRALASGFPILFLLIIVAFCASKAGAIDISITGSWSATIDASNLTGGAGTDLAGTYESELNQGVIAITNTAGSTDAWRVDVSRTDTNWPAAFAIYCKRTSSGTGSGSISGGTSYQEITTTSASFFSGTGDRSGVNIQLQVTGVSLTVAPDTYSSTITYTVVDTP